MRRNRALTTLVVLTLITLPVLAIGEAPAAPEIDKTAAETLAQLIEPPLETPCVSTECIDIMVFAHNPETGECREFPNPCSVPSGWVLGCP